MDYVQEQDMEVEALRAILMDEFQELEENDEGSTGLKTSSKCYQITISPKGDDEDEPTEIPVRLALYFAHTPQYPDEAPLLSVKSMQGVRQADLDEIRTKLEEEAQQSLGMAMMYTLATTAKECLREKYGQVQEVEDDDEEEKEEVIEAHGLPVTVETFMAWRERFEAEIALEQAKLIPDAALAAAKEKRLTGRQWFAMKASKGLVAEVEDEEGEEEIDFDDDDDLEDIDEDEMLEHYLEEKGETA